jgi:hypothetical protein
MGRSDPMNDVGANTVPGILKLLSTGNARVMTER